MSAAKDGEPGLGLHPVPDEGERALQVSPPCQGRSRGCVVTECSERPPLGPQEHQGWEGAALSREQPGLRGLPHPELQPPGPLGRGLGLAAGLGQALLCRTRGPFLRPSGGCSARLPADVLLQLLSPGLPAALWKEGPGQATRSPGCEVRRTPQSRHCSAVLCVHVCRTACAHVPTHGTYVHKHTCAHASDMHAHVCVPVRAGPAVCTLSDVVVPLRSPQRHSGTEAICVCWNLTWDSGRV